MNLLFVANKLNIEGGGSNHSLNLMAQSMSERGHEVTVVTLNIYTENVVPEDTPYEIQSRQSSSQVGVIRTLLEVLEEYESWADLVHCFFSPFIPICGLYRRRGGETPVIGRLNNYIMFCTNISAMEGSCYEHCLTLDKIRHDNKATNAKLKNIPFYMARTHAVPRLASKVDRIFAISPAVKRIHVSNGLDGDRIAVVPNFHDPVHETDAGLDERVSGERADVTDALYVGRIAREKGIDLLVEAAYQLDRPDLRLHVVGDGDLLLPLQRDAERAGIDDTVIFHGRVDYDELPRYYEAADLFVHPGRWPEPFGRTILEAMQHDCPLLVSNVGGPPWIAGDSGVTFESESAADLARQLSRLCNDEELLTDLSNSCPEELRRFDRDDVVTEIERHYRAVVG